jgi:hypothetical protein
MLNGYLMVASSLAELRMIERQSGGELKIEIKVRFAMSAWM